METSLTYQAVAVMVFAYVLKAAGNELPHPDVANFVATGSLIISSLVALYGRWRAGGITWWGKKL